MSQPIRVRLHGCLECQSPLHVGSGEREAVVKRDRAAPPGQLEKEKGDFDAVCVTGGDSPRPYLPATTLRGFLRAQLAGGERQALRKRLFGYVEEHPGEPDGQKKAWAGKVRVYNALLRDDAVPRAAPGIVGNRLWRRGSLIRQNVALDPLTLTADAHRLFSYEYLPTGSRFGLTLELEDPGQDDLASLLGLLDAWDGGVGSAVGRGTGRLQGRLRWTLERVEALDLAGLDAWLNSDRPLDECFQTLQAIPAPQALAKPAPKPVPFRIHALAPVLVNDPGQVKRRPKDGGPQENENAPSLEYSRAPDGRPALPASSLRGVARGRARRILATLLAGRGLRPTQATGQAETLAKQVFGQEDRRGLVWIGDAVQTPLPSEEGGEARAALPHPQHFNAIDRFTGGVADGKLYNVNAQDGGVYAGELALEAEKLEDWSRGLLLLVLRDALEGDLTVGWGKARGYGAFRLALQSKGRWIADWPGLLAELGRPQAQTWIDALHRQIQQTAAALQQNEAQP